MTMPAWLHHHLSIDGPPLLAAVLAAIVCGLLGNWLVLRRASLMGDAISHAVLPGIVVAFLLSGTRSPLPMFLGALVAGGLTALLSAVVRRLARVEPGAAMGVVFTTLFALGVVLIEQAAARQVDLDPDCVLYGSLETLFWFPPSTWGEFFSVGTLALLPTPVATLAATTVGIAIVLRLLRKELALASFDAEFATLLGFRAGSINAILMFCTALATVASFEAVGSILVVALLVCPAATARLWTDRLATQIRLSVAFAAAAALAGYLVAATAPMWLGTERALNAAGMIATVAGAFLVLSMLASPSHGVVAASLRRRALAVRIAREDVLAFLHRLAESSGGAAAATDADVRRSLAFVDVEQGVRDGVRRGQLERDGDRIRLTVDGARTARDIVRSHRLWESYLVEEVGLAADHVHQTAEQLEHWRSDQLAPPPRERDPHGRSIPE